ncbi:uncharacterized protein V1518DRAFT_457310 [Limtongia smithiae]|uniref:uncharacterized protein n=1 Tax=Limtongia smithiae TaxID=1125753 RepID=UPI0034CED51C
MSPTHSPPHLLPVAPSAGPATLLKPDVVAHFDNHLDESTVTGICAECCCCFDDTPCTDESCAFGPNGQQLSACADCHEQQDPSCSSDSTASSSAPPTVAGTPCDIVPCELPDCGLPSAPYCAWDDYHDACGPSCPQACTSPTSCCSSCSSPSSTMSGGDADEAVGDEPAVAAKVGTKRKICHWGDDCTFSFTSPADLDEHLRTSHIAFLEHQLRESEQQEQRRRHLQQLQEQERAQASLISSQEPAAPENMHLATMVPMAETSISEDVNHHAMPLSCQWDSCQVTAEELDALLDHIKNDHMMSPPFSAPSISAPTSTELPDLPTSMPMDNVIQCQWNQCSDTYAVASTAAVDAHLLGHLSGLSMPMLQCRWDECHFATGDSGSLVSHVVQDHIPQEQPSQVSTPVPAVSVTTHHTHTHHHHPHHDQQHISHVHSHEAFAPNHAHHHHHHSNDQDEPAESKCLWVTDGVVCNHVFDSTQTLSEHIIESHVGARKQEYTCMWHGCDRNTRPFQQRQKMVRHLQIHTRNRPFECTVCGHRFAEQLVLTQHMRVHSGEKPYSCKVCGKRFAASTALSVHLRTHTGEKPLKCKWPGCNKSFSESSNLAKHMRTHTADRRFKCSAPGCGKEFLRHDQLMRHMRIHDNVKSNEQAEMVAVKTEQQRAMLPPDMITDFKPLKQPA